MYISVYILGSEHMPVMCVIKQSKNGVLWSFSNVYILGSVHIAVMSIIKHSETEVVWMFISRYILVSVCSNVNCVIKLSGLLEHMKVHQRVRSGECSYGCDVCKKYSGDWLLWRYINWYIRGASILLWCVQLNIQSQLCSKGTSVLLYSAIVISSYIYIYIYINHSLCCIFWVIVTIYRSWSLYFCGILKGFSTVHWYFCTLGQKSCMSNCARIFRKFEVYMYFGCVEMTDIVVYE